MLLCCIFPQDEYDAGHDKEKYAGFHENDAQFLEKLGEYLAHMLIRRAYW